MMDTMDGLIKLMAVLQAQKSRGWIAHNEFDYFTLCPTCGSWFDCRDPTNLIKHKHDVTASIVVASVVQTSTHHARAANLDFPNQRLTGANVAAETPDVLLNDPDSGAKP
jgi:hypothetical protein